ncbi:fructosamine-3-kinase [Xylariaceae sp. FL1019]|nr:fructosamine-3-kinase [Xylariaceae sp. FL1019]
MAPIVDAAIIEALGLEPASAKVGSRSGYGFASTFKMSGTIGGKEAFFFIKVAGDPEGKVMLEGEFASLKAIHDAMPDFCPTPHAHGALRDDPGKYFLAMDFIDLSAPANPNSETLTQKLARLHSMPAPVPDGFDRPMYGFPVTTCCGSTPQDNSWKSSWAEFYAENRLRAVFRAGERKHGADGELAKAVEQTASVVVPRLLGDDHLKGVQPVIIHGDLWSGNHGSGRISGQDNTGVVLYDPSSVYGHSEYELGIIRMFGDPGPRFWKEYKSLLPVSEPKEEWEDRVTLYELYHHLNHWAIFGGSYKGGAMRIMQKLISKYG